MCIKHSLIFNNQETELNEATHLLIKDELANGNLRFL